MRRLLGFAALGFLYLGAPAAAEAQAPVAGQSYQVPAEYAGTAPGTTITYAGYSYLIQQGGTMVLAQQPQQQPAGPGGAGTTTPSGPAPTPGQPYAIPPELAGTAPGTTITYAGYPYVIQQNGTMLPVSPQDQPGGAGGGAPGADDDQGPVVGEPYAIPPELAGAAVGTTVSYGGYDYVIQADGTMTPVARGDQTQGQGPVPGQPYAIPPELAGAAVGTTVSYGGHAYLIQQGGTMTLADPGNDDAPVAGEPYAIPPELAGAAVGSTVEFGGYSYVIQADGSMIPAGAGAGNGAAEAPQPNLSYQVPAQFVNAAPGTAVSYGGFPYVIRSGGTMVYTPPQGQGQGITTVVDTATGGIEEMPAVGQPYEVPPEYAGNDPGTIIQLAGNPYELQGDGTMLYDPLTAAYSSAYPPDGGLGMGMGGGLLGPLMGMGGDMPFLGGFFGGMPFLGGLVPPLYFGGGTTINNTNVLPGAGGVTAAGTTPATGGVTATGGPAGTGTATGTKTGTGVKTAGNPTGTATGTKTGTGTATGTKTASGTKVPGQRTNGVIWKPPPGSRTTRLGGSGNRTAGALTPSNRVVKKPPMGTGVHTAGTSTLRQPPTGNRLTGTGTGTGAIRQPSTAVRSTLRQPPVRSSLTSGTGGLRQPLARTNMANSTVRQPPLRTNANVNTAAGMTRQPQTSFRTNAATGMVRQPPIRTGVAGSGLRQPTLTGRPAYQPTMLNQPTNLGTMTRQPTMNMNTMARQPTVNMNTMPRQPTMNMGTVGRSPGLGSAPVRAPTPSFRPPTSNFGGGRR